MTFKHIFDPIAFEEYKTAIDWYDERSVTSGDNFISSVTEKIIDICATPDLYKITYKQYRESALKKFPYSIVYLIDKKLKTIIITSVYHHKRSPKRKYKK